MQEEGRKNGLNITTVIIIVVGPSHVTVVVHDRVHPMTIFPIDDSPSIYHRIWMMLVMNGIFWVVSFGKERSQWMLLDDHVVDEENHHPFVNTFHRVKFMVWIA
jgi:hypothetical protein